MIRNTVVALCLLSAVAFVWPDQREARGLVAPPSATTAPKNPADTNPIDAPIPAVLEFRRRLDDATYSERATALMKDFKADPDAAFAGTIIFNVDADSPAQAIGLERGDVVCEIDGTQVISEAGYSAARKLDSAQPARIWSTKDHSYRTVELQAGKLGIGTSDFWSLQNEYLHSLGKDEAPNPDLRIAARAAATDGELAETALAHANLHTPMANLIAAAVAYFEVRLDDCLAYATAALPDLKDPDRQYAQVLAYRSALATFRWTAAQQIGSAGTLAFSKKELPDDKLLNFAMFALKLMPVEEMSRPADAFLNLKSTDRTNELANSEVNPDYVDVSEQDAAQFRAQQKINMDPPDGHYNSFTFGPKGANVDLQARFQYHPTDSNTSQFFKNMRICLIDKGKWDTVVLTIYASDGAAEITGRHLPAYRVNVGQLCSGGRPFDVHLTAAGGRCEIDINNDRIFYGPLFTAPSDRELTWSAAMVGLTGQIDHVSWKTADAAVKQ